MKLQRQKPKRILQKIFKIRLESMDIYSLKGFCGKMLTPDQEGSIAGVEAVGRTKDERYASETWLRSSRSHRDMTVERRLAVRQIAWASQSIGEALYMNTLWILKWKGNYSIGSKINRGSQVEAELRISMWVAGEDWETISIVHRWVAIKGKSAPRVMASPFEMWEILTGWNQNEVTLPRRNLRI